MIGYRRLSALSVALAGLPLAANAFCPDEDACVDPSTPRRIVIRVADYSNIDEALLRIRQFYPQTQIDDAIESRQIYELLLPVGVDECSAHAIIEDAFVNETPAFPDPNLPLIWVEAGYRGIAAEGQTGSIFDSNRVNYGPRYPQQYLVSQLNVSAAQATSSGAGVTVAVLDSGIDATHPALAGAVRADGVNLVRENGRAADDTRDIGDGVDSNGRGGIDEMTGHGTFVAGLIHLVAPEAQLLPIVVLDSDGDSDCFLVGKALFHALDSGAQVVNCSVATTYGSQLFVDALLEAKAAGVLVVGAAGNRGLGPFQPPCPEFPATTMFEQRQAADIPLGVGVAAVTHQSIKVASSSHSRDLILSASGGSVPDPGIPGAYDPERSIISTLPDNSWGVWEGTSFPTALVSGTAALMASKRPAWANAQYFDRARYQLTVGGMNLNALNPQYAGRLGVQINIGRAIGASRGDLDGDGVVGLQDLAFLLSRFGTRDFAFDVDGDIPLDPWGTPLATGGSIGLQDLAILLSNFGE